MLALTPENKVLQTVSVPHTGNRFWWNVLNQSRVVSSGRVVKPETKIAWAFAEPHRTLVFMRHPVDVEISFRNRGEPSLCDQFYHIFREANERTLFVRTDCPVSERDAEVAKLQAVVDLAMGEQAALGYTFKPLRHPIATDWAGNPDHSVKGEWAGRRDEVLADLRRDYDLAPFAALGYEV